MDIITWEPKDSLKIAEFYMNYEYPKGMNGPILRAIAHL